VSPAGLRSVAASIHFHFREQWRELKRGRPGHRFQERYERARRGDVATWERVLFLVAAVILVLLGVFFAIFPGPALPFFFVGGGLLASESRTVARFMDWSEVGVRQWATWGRRRWKRLPNLARAGLVLLGAGMSAATMYLSFRIFR